MIQRVQSLFFLGVFAICLLFLLVNVPYAEVTGADEIKVIGFGTQFKTLIPSAGGEVRTPEVYYMLLFGSLCITSILSIFLYKNLDMQSKATRLIALVSLLGIVLPLLTVFLTKGSDVSVLPGMFLFVLPLLFSILALRGIKQDKELLAKMNRIR